MTAKNLSIVSVICLCTQIALGGLIVSKPDSGWGYDEENYVPDCDSATQQSKWTVNGKDIALSLAPATSFSDMYVMLKTGSSNTMLTMGGSDTFMNDFEASDELETDPKWLRHIHINQADGPLCDMDFVLAGTLYIDWAGEAFSREEMGLHVNLTQIPEPASIIMLILVSVTGLFVRRRFKV